MKQNLCSKITSNMKQEKYKIDSNKSLKSKTKQPQNFVVYI